MNIRSVLLLPSRTELPLVRSRRSAGAGNEPRPPMKTWSQLAPPHPSPRDLGGPPRRWSAHPIRCSNPLHRCPPSGSPAVYRISAGCSGRRTCASSLRIIRSVEIPHVRGNSITSQCNVRPWPVQAWQPRFRFKSLSTISTTIASKDLVGAQPSICDALEASPTNVAGSTLRTNLGSWMT